jgi:hypothetical protein
LSEKHAQSSSASAAMIPRLSVMQFPLSVWPAEAIDDRTHRRRGDSP